MTTVQLTDVQTLRDRARKNIQEGAVTEGYSADRQTVLRLLNEALATELVCFLRYKRHYFMATGLKASIAAAEFLEHANQEMQHADQLAERIMQLGGEPDFNPRGLEERSHAEYVEGKTLKDMVTENLIAERIAIDSYREIITYLGNDDPTTRRIFRGNPGPGRRTRGRHGRHPRRPRLTPEQDPSESRRPQRRLFFSPYLSNLSIK